MTQNVACSISGLRKSYSAPVLRGVDLELNKGEVHALVGANGAGKSTLCKILCGATGADAGEITLHGAAYRPMSVRDAERAGVRIVMQEFNLIPNLSVAENLFFGRMPQSKGLIDFKLLFDRAASLLDDMGMRFLDPRMPLQSLGIGHQQLVEIARAVSRPCQVLLLDEPTAALTGPQIDLLFHKIGKLKAKGTAIVYVSHRLNEIKEISDRISILRDGVTIASLASDSISNDEIVKKMAGNLQEFQAGKPGTTKSVALAVKRLGTRVLREIDLEVCYGEILGIAGLVGAGRTELLRVMFGADGITAGHIEIGEQSVVTKFRSPADAIAHGIGMIPEDRKTQGLFLNQSLVLNTTLSSLKKFSGYAGWVSHKAEVNAAEEYRQQLRIDCHDVSQPVGELSGGNQQKVSIARWLLKDCGILLFDEPTRGVDIQAKSVIYGLLMELKSEGKALVIVSSESRELTELCDRIAVLSNGRLAAVFGRGEWTSERIMSASLSEHLDDKRTLN